MCGASSCSPARRAQVSVLLRLMHDYMRWRVDEVRRGEDILALTRSSRTAAGIREEQRAFCKDCHEML